MTDPAALAAVADAADICAARYGIWRNGNPDPVAGPDDVRSAATVAAWEATRSCQPGADLRSWVLHKAHYASVSYLRTVLGRHGTPKGDAASRARATFRRYDDPEAHNALHAAVASRHASPEEATDFALFTDAVAALPVREREVVEARLTDDTLAQLGVRHGVSDARFSQHLRDARRTLAPFRP